MPIQSYTPTEVFSRLYYSMACHVFALSGNTGTIINVNTKYNKLGEYLTGVSQPPSEAMRNKIENVVNAIGNMREMTLELLCDQFDLKIRSPAQAATNIHLCGLFRNNLQMLPEHMWITRGGMIYDTMPGAPIRRNTNQNKLNPPSERYMLNQAQVFSVELSALTPHQIQVINSHNWRQR